MINSPSLAVHSLPSTPSDEPRRSTSPGHGPDASARDSSLPASVPGQGQANTSKLTLLAPFLESLERQKHQTIEYQTGYAVALQNSELAKLEKLPPLMLSFSHHSLRGARAAAPHLPRVLNVDENDLPEDLPKLLKELECVAVDLDYHNVTPEIIHAVHQAGCRIMSYTVNDPKRIQELFDMGIDNVITDMIHVVDPHGYQRWDQKEGADTSAYKDLPPWPYPPMVGHRFAGKDEVGNKGAAPENTEAGAKALVEHDYEAGEYDVNMSTDPDPILFLMHDDELDRTTDGTGPASRPWSELAQLSAGIKHSQKFADEPIPPELPVAMFLINKGVARMVEIKPMPNPPEAKDAAPAKA